ncbi:hypothetical protein LV89_02273 [Arcicella aurantiaca]|uniref:Uncharacterized protein n=1 Tax=Arcicella aurantiaca TaxID=591202 RepID=A0A316EU85_9BACT|nr:hypothetical protein LV89_02273 [Arcicella aurantiaca]
MKNLKLYGFIFMFVPVVYRFLIGLNVIHNMNEYRYLVFFLGFIGISIIFYNSVLINKKDRLFYGMILLIYSIILIRYSYLFWLK